MFQFNVEWPLWMPWLGGSQIFPAIWNVADACISLGIFTVLIRQQKYFPKQTRESESV
jgi:signal peptidase II